MRILVLGGTKFLGRAVAEAALARGHELTLFTRGRTNPDLFPRAKHLRGDRDGGLGALAGRRWDAVVDPSGYVPRVVRASAELLRDSGHYVFVSSISAYRDPQQPGYDESGPLEELADPASEDVPRDYGALKAACERVVEEVFPGRSASIRAGLIVGPHDPTGRFTYWPVRMARGGAALCPGPPEQPWQLVDARDLGEWIVHVCEERHAGAFNATSPPQAAADVLTACRSAAGSDAELVWVDGDWLRERGVGEWMELPLWIPSAAWIHTADVSRAVEAGLRFRPVEDTARDTLAWVDAEGGAPAPLASGVEIGEAGMRPEREAQLLAAWSGR